MKMIVPFSQTCRIRRSHCFLLIVSVIAFCGISVSAEVADRSNEASSLSSDVFACNPSAKRKVWSALACGPNSLYAVSRLLGVQVDEDTIWDRLELSERGATMPQLRDAAAACGISMAIRRCSIDELGALTPLVAHMTIAGRTTASRGHYVAVVNVNDRSIQFIDGTTGALQTCSRERFEKLSSGYVLVPAVNMTNSDSIAGMRVSVMLWLVIGFFLVFPWSHVSRTPSKDLA